MSEITGSSNDLNLMSRIFYNKQIIIMQITILENEINLELSSNPSQHLNYKQKIENDILEIDGILFS